MSHRELDAERDSARSRAAEAIEQLRREEQEARDRGDMGTADLHREQREHLERFDHGLSQLDGARMIQDKIAKWTYLARPRLLRPAVRLCFLTLPRRWAGTASNRCATTAVSSA